MITDYNLHSKNDSIAHHGGGVALIFTKFRCFIPKVSKLFLGDRQFDTVGKCQLKATDITDIQWVDQIALVTSQE